MRQVFRTGGCEYDMFLRSEKRTFHTFEGACSFLQRLLDEPRGSQLLRSLLESCSPGQDLTRLDDGEMVQVLAPHLLSGEVCVVERRPAEDSLAFLTIEKKKRPKPEAPALSGEQKELSWIEVYVLGEDDTPITGEPYEIKLSDGRRTSGTTDANGRIRYDRIPDGTCELSLTNLDASAWVARTAVESHTLSPPSGEPARTGAGFDVVNLSWSQKEARSGDTVRLLAATRGLDGESVRLLIYEYDRDGGHDQIATLTTTVDGGKINTSWAYEYHEDLDEAGGDEGQNYHPPEYFFVVKARGRTWGEQQQSGLLTFRSWIKVKLTNGLTDPMDGEPYRLYLSTGELREGKLDSDGLLYARSIPPGKVFVEFPGLFHLVEVKDGQYELDHELPAEDPDQEEDREQGEGYEELHQRQAPEEDDEDEDKDEDKDEDEEEDELPGGLEQEPGMPCAEKPESRVPAVLDRAYTSGSVHYEVACRHCVSGRQYHLAVIHHCSVELLDEWGMPPDEPLQCQIRDSDGVEVFSGATDRRGRVQQGGVAMGDYEVLVGDNSWWVVSVPHPGLRQRVTLHSEEEAE